MLTLKLAVYLKFNFNWALCIFIWRIHTATLNTAEGESSQCSGKVGVPLLPLAPGPTGGHGNRVSDLEEPIGKLSGLFTCHAAYGAGRGLRKPSSQCPSWRVPYACLAPQHPQKLLILSPRLILMPTLGSELVLSPLHRAGGPGHRGGGGGVVP